MFLNALGFLLGSLTLLVVSDTTQATVIVILALVGIVVILPKILADHHSNHLKITLFLWFFLGLAWSNASLLVWSASSNSLVKEPQITRLEGSICSIPTQQDLNWRFDFCVDSIGEQTLAWYTRNRIRTLWSQYSIQPSTPIEAGQRWQLKVKLRPIHGRVNPAGFDYEKWLVAEGFLATATVRNEAKRLDSSGAYDAYQRFRQRAFDNFQSILPDSPNKPIMLALLMGERAAINDQQWQVFQQSGTAHLLAISGLHIGIAALWSYWLVFLCWRTSAFLCRLIPAQSVAEVVSLLGALMLVLLSGFGLPAQRALLMIVIYFASRWCGIHLKLVNVLGWALILVLLWQPFAVLQTSFWLSFYAVLIIALILNRQIIQPASWRAWLRINGYLYVALIPISWLFFDSFSWVALVANLVLIPLTTFVLTPLLYLGALVSVVTGTVASMLFTITDYLLSISYQLQSKLAEANSIITPNVDVFTGSALFLLAFMLLLPRRIVSRWAFLPLSMLMILPGRPAVDKPPLSLLIFDIGQGLAVYIDTPQGNLLYDTGWGNEKFAAADSTLIPYLKQFHINRIEQVIISHSDSDHSGGLASVAKSVEIGQIDSGEPLTEAISNDCHQLKPWQWGEVAFSVLASVPGSKVEGNNSSCVVSIDVAGKRILLTGDIEKAGEQQLLNNGLGAYDLLVAPHHGSETSSTKAFVERVKPQQVIFSTGYDNQWHFPRQTVIERYQNVGSKIWITHKDGAIIANVNASGELTIQGYRQQRPGFWR